MPIKKKPTKALAVVPDIVDGEVIAVDGVARPPVTMNLSLNVAVKSENFTGSLDDLYAIVKVAVETAAPGCTAVKFGGNYIFNGKSYFEKDFDFDKGEPKEGALYIGENPTAKQPAHLKTVEQTLAEMKSRKERSPREALDDLAQHLGPRKRTAKPVVNDDDDVDDSAFEWDATDLGSDKVEKLAEDAVSDAVAKLQKKRIVKKSDAVPPKRVIKRKK